MPNPSASSAGYPDTVFVERLREFVEDLPVFSPQNTTANGSASEYRAVDFPLYDGDPYNDGTQRFVIKAGTPYVTQALVDQRADLTAANQIAIDYETGWIYWHPNFPPSGALLLRVSKVRWRNQRLLEALYAGLRAMRRLCLLDQVDTSVTLQTLVWEYTLPAIFWDPAVRIAEVEVLDIPASLNRYVPIDWRRGSMSTLIIPDSQLYTPGATIRIRYHGPPQSLSDLPDSWADLPVMYAKGYLLSNKEIVRVRQDTANVTMDQNANPVGSSQNAGSFFYQQFERELLRAQQVITMPRPLVTYQR